MKVYKTLALLALVFTLGGCTMASKAAFNEAVDKIKDFNEGEARLAVTTLCAMRVGAMYRELSVTERGHVIPLCGGEEPASVPIDTLRALGLSIKGPEGPTE